MLRDVLTVVLAGGKGTRLEPLTRDRAKPAVPFGGQYRIIDFTLSNCINSGLRRVRVLTQFKSHSLDRHIRSGWSFSKPRTRRVGRRASAATADRRALVPAARPTPSIRTFTASNANEPRTCSILAGDHIYKMDYGKMIDEHRANNADATIGCIPVPVTESNQFGIMSAGNDGRVTAFRKSRKPADELPNDPRLCAGIDGHLCLHRCGRCSTGSATMPPARRVRTTSARMSFPAMLESGGRVFAHRFKPKIRP